MKWLSALLTATAAMTVVAATPPATLCPPAPSASQPTATTAPTTPAERSAEVGPVNKDRNEGVVVPQVAVPLKLGTPDATALKPGKHRNKTSGQVDDAAARCRAARP
jgi:hypothetical protein